MGMKKDPAAIRVLFQSVNPVDNCNAPAGGGVPAGAGGLGATFVDP